MKIETKILYSISKMLLENMQIKSQLIQEQRKKYFQILNDCIC